MVRRKRCLVEFRTVGTLILEGRGGLWLILVCTAENCRSLANPPKSCVNLLIPCTYLPETKPKSSPIFWDQLIQVWVFKT